MGTTFTILRTATAVPMSARKITTPHSTRRMRLPGSILCNTQRLSNYFAALFFFRCSLCVEALEGRQFLLRRPCDLEIREIPPLTIFFFLFHQPLPAAAIF